MLLYILGFSIEVIDVLIWVHKLIKRDVQNHLFFQLDNLCCLLVGNVRHDRVPRESGAQRNNEVAFKVDFLLP
jgi:hypothetical protein